MQPLDTRENITYRVTQVRAHADDMSKSGVLERFFVLKPGDKERGHQMS